MWQFQKISGMRSLPLLMILSLVSMAAAQNLDNTRWSVVYYQQGSLLQVAQGATAEFSAEQINGSTGCNLFAASYQQNGNQISFGPARLTRRACENATLNGQEQTLMQNLSQVRRFSLGQGVLQLQNNSGQTLIILAATSPSLLGEWRVLSINNRAVLRNTPLSLRFGDNGRASGQGGCNQFSAPFTQQGNNLKLGPTMSTLRACTPDIDRQESAYFAALGQVSRFKQSDSQLELLNEQGQSLIRLER